MTTKISPYRTGTPRFGNKDTGPVNGEVVTYQLSPVELEAYRNKGGFKLLTKEDYLKRKEQGKTDKDIMQEFNCNHNRMNMLKKEWGLIGAFRTTQESNSNPQETPVPVEKPKLIIELEQQLQKETDRVAKLEQEIEALVKEHHQEVEKVKASLEKKTTEYEQLLSDYECLLELQQSMSKELDKVPETESEFAKVADLTRINEQLQEENSELRGFIYTLKKAIKIIA